MPFVVLPLHLVSTRSPFIPMGTTVIYDVPAKPVPFVTFQSRIRQKVHDYKKSEFLPWISAY